MAGSQRRVAAGGGGADGRAAGACGAGALGPRRAAGRAAAVVAGAPAGPARRRATLVSACIHLPFTTFTTLTVYINFLLLGPARRRATLVSARGAVRERPPGRCCTARAACCDEERCLRVPGREAARLRSRGATSRTEGWPSSHRLAALQCVCGGLRRQLSRLNARPSAWTMCGGGWEWLQLGTLAANTAACALNFTLTVRTPPYRPAMTRHTCDALSSLHPPRTTRLVRPTLPLPYLPARSALANRPTISCAGDRAAAGRQRRRRGAEWHAVGRAGRAHERAGGLPEHRVHLGGGGEGGEACGGGQGRATV